MPLSVVQINKLNLLIQDIRSKYNELYGTAQTVEQVIWDLSNASEIKGVTAFTNTSIFKVNTLKRELTALISQYNALIKSVTPLPVE